MSRESRVQLALLLGHILALSFATGGAIHHARRLYLAVRGEQMGPGL